MYAALSHSSGASVLAHAYRPEAATEHPACLRVAGSDLARALHVDPGPFVDASDWGPGDPALTSGLCAVWAGPHAGRAQLSRSTVLAIAAWPDEHVPVTWRGPYPVIGGVVVAPDVPWTAVPPSLPRSPFTAALAAGVRNGSRTWVRFSTTHLLVETPFIEASSPLDGMVKWMP